MASKDERVKCVTEAITGIRVLKYHVWEDHFIQKIKSKLILDDDSSSYYVFRFFLELRNSELKYLKGRKYLDALCVYFWATTPVLISILTFTTYTLMGNKLTAAKVCYRICNFLVQNLIDFSGVYNNCPT
jgi:ATP-binding cassette, subfamily C (CFTR/MRP), member 10